MSTSLISRQPKGVPAGGQFAATARPESAVDLGPHAPVDLGEALLAGEDELVETDALDAEDVCSECAESLADNEGYDGLCGNCADKAESAQMFEDTVEELRTQRFDLAFVEHDDKLTDEQITNVLAGRWSPVEEQVAEVFEEDVAKRAEEAAREHVENTGGMFEALSDDQRQQLIEMVRDQDDSDPLSDLVQRTPDQLMRTSLGTPASRAGNPAIVSDVTDEVVTAREQAIVSMLADRGLDITPAVREAVSELVANRPYQWHEGVDLDVIWYGDLETAMARPRY